MLRKYSMRSTGVLYLDDNSLMTPGSGFSLCLPSVGKVILFVFFEAEVDFLTETGFDPPILYSARREKPKAKHKRKTERNRRITSPSWCASCRAALFLEE